MWFTGRVSGAATVLVLDPSQVTGLPDEPGAFDAEVPPAVFEPAVVDPAVDLPPEEPVEPVEPVDAVELEPASDEAAPDDGLVEVDAAAPSSLAPVPSLQAVRESAARTAVTAAAARRVREVRRSDMSL